MPELDLLFCEDISVQTHLELSHLEHVLESGELG